MLQPPNYPYQANTLVIKLHLFWQPIQVFWYAIMAVTRTLYIITSQIHLQVHPR